MSENKKNPQSIDFIQAGALAIHWMGQQAEGIQGHAVSIENALDKVLPDFETARNQASEIAKKAGLLAEMRRAFVGQEIMPVFRPALVEDVVQSAAFHAGLRDERLVIGSAPDTPMAWTDSSQLASALFQIFKNAAEAGAKNISAHITPTLDGLHVAISIADDGPGISPAEQEKIWGEFYTTKGPDHTGLGLTAALFAINRLGGRITLDSDAGRGAVFTIILPVAEEDDAIDLSHAPGHILFIDEANDRWANFAANVLKLAGKDVIVQESPAGAAAADLILVDEALTTMDAADVLSDLCEAGLAGKAVIMTAWLSKDRAEKYSLMGAKDVALKPYTFAALSAFLRFETQFEES